MSLLEVIFAPIKALSALVPSNKRVWVFGAWSGSSFSDNSKAFFEYVQKNHSGITSVWLAKDRGVVEHMRSAGYTAFRFYSLKGIYYSVISGVAIMSCSWKDLPVTTFIFSQKKVLAQLWHGTPLKKMELKNGTPLQKVLRSVLIKYMGREYDLVFSATQKNVAVYQEVFNISAQDIKITGQPRNDYLFTPKRYPSSSEKRIKILYMPTWRPYEMDYFSYGFNEGSFDEMLRKNNALLVVKIHPNEVEKYKKTLHLQNVEFWSQADVYEYLGDFDLLITDYSSIFFDFALLSKPVVFAPFDFEKYKHEVGLLYDYNSLAGSNLARNWNEAAMVISARFNMGDEYVYSQNERLKAFNQFYDNCSSARVFDEIWNALAA